jgi:hypothetical protein
MDVERLAQLHRHIIRKMRIRHPGPLPLGCPGGKRAQVAELFQDFQYTRGIEIGTWAGDSAVVICQSVPGVELVCVDPWKPYRAKDTDATEAIYNQAVNALAPFNVTILRTTSMDAVKAFPDNHFDFANIDGDHAFDFACSDLIFWMPKIRKHGMVAVHDYDPHVPGVVHAVNAYTHCHCISPWFVTQERRHPATAFWVKPE